MYIKAEDDSGLNDAEIRNTIEQSLIVKNIRKALLIPPDITRYYSFSGPITKTYFELLTSMGAQVDILPSIGTHAPMSLEEIEDMYAGIPPGRFITHNWREDIVSLGSIEVASFFDVGEDILPNEINVSVNQRLVDQSYDIIISIGQVVPHEVVGMANYTKNLFVGVGGFDMIGKSHIIGAIYGMERLIGKDHSPVRKILDYCYEHFLSDRPIIFALTVTSTEGGHTALNGLYIGDERCVFEDAVINSQQKNIIYVEKPIKKCIAFLGEHEFKSTWVGNKAIYRSRMALEDGGELIILAPGVHEFGEEKAVDLLIRKYGYCGTKQVMNLMRSNADLREYPGVAAHLIHGSSEGRFSVTYAAKRLSSGEIEGVNFKYADYDDMIKKYNPAFLNDGFNQVPDGEEVYYISNPALGLWAYKQRLDNMQNKL